MLLALLPPLSTNRCDGVCFGHVASCVLCKLRCDGVCFGPGASNVLCKPRCYGVCCIQKVAYQIDTKITKTKTTKQIYIYW